MNGETKLKILIVCTTDSMIWNFLIPHIKSFMNKGYEVECACSVTGFFFDDLREKHGLIMHQIDVKRSPFSFSNIKAIFQLNRILKKFNPNVVFCHEPVGGVIGRLVGAINNCKVVYMAHGFHFYKGAPRRNKIFYIVERVLSKYTDVLITINREDYEATEKFRSKERHLINGIGINTSDFSYKPQIDCLRKELKIGKKEIILLSVGELIKRKNHETVINAIIKMNNPAIHYVIAGEGELSKTLRNLIQESGNENIHLLGFRTDIDDLCNSSDIFVLPSIQEGLSVALMEAMSCGLPIIASKIRGNTDLIDENEGGILVEATKVDKYIEAISALINEPEKRKQMGIYNANKIKAYDTKLVGEELISIMENINKKVG